MRKTPKIMRCERIPSAPSPLQRMKISSKTLWFTYNFEAIVYMFLSEIIIAQHIVTKCQVISITIKMSRFFCFVGTYSKFKHFQLYWQNVIWEFSRRFLLWILSLRVNILLCIWTENLHHTKQKKGLKLIDPQHTRDLIVWQNLCNVWNVLHWSLRLYMVT